MSYPADPVSLSHNLSMYLGLKSGKMLIFGLFWFVYCHIKEFCGLKAKPRRAIFETRQHLMILGIQMLKSNHLQQCKIRLLRFLSVGIYGPYFTKRR